MNRDEILVKIEDCFLIAEKFYNRTFDRPTKIIFKRNGTRGGCFRYNRSMTIRELEFQLDMAEQNDDYAQTVIHEVAHNIQHAVYGFDVKPHGREWKYVMRMVYKVPADRCHSYSIENTTTKKQSRFDYKCGCGKMFKLTTTKHNRMQSYPRAYVCQCRGTISFVGRNIETEKQKLERQIFQLQQKLNNKI